MQYQVLARKYRPTNFSEVVGQSHVVQALSNALSQNKIHHAYLFTGTRGIGKTTLARIFAKCLNCESGLNAIPCDQCASCQEITEGHFPDFYEVDAASRTKVEDTRELLENVQYAPTKGRFKIYLIDEVHMLSGHSFNALLKTLEEPPEHVKFLLATTDPQKLPPTVLSRCLQFHLNQLAPAKIAEHLAHVLTQENIRFDQSAVELIGQAAHGSIRDSLSLLDQCIAFGNGTVLTNEVKTMLGTIEPTTLFEILRALANKNGEGILHCINQLNEQGVDFSQALSELLTLLHKINLVQLVPNAPMPEHKTELNELAQVLSPEDIQLFYQMGIIGQRDFSFAPSPQIGFEMTLLRMLAFYPNSNENEPKPKPVSKSHSNQQTKQPALNTEGASHWHEMLTHLNLSGAALALAKSCSLDKITDTHVYLNASIRQKPLIQPKQTTRINEALNQYLNRQVTLKINLLANVQGTPASIAKLKATQAHESAKQAITEDPKIKQFMDTFDATLIDNSITTLDENRK